LTAAEMLAECQLMSLEPTTSQLTTPANWYSLLTRGEAHWKPIIAAHYPGPMYGNPTLLTAASDAKTFTWATSSVPAGMIPLSIELYYSLTGRMLLPGTYDDGIADYVLEGDTVRITRGRSFSFPAGAPYARFVTPPGTIDASTDSTIEPKPLRVLPVYHALQLWASRGGYQDPSFYRSLAQKAAFGDPDINGDIGLLGALKLQNPAHGMAAVRQSGSFAYWRPSDG
jgi:hypothetical protein